MAHTRQIWLPCSTFRNDPRSYLQLLNRARKEGTRYWFEGAKLLRPGKHVPEATLNPPGFPEVPILLECAGTPGSRGHKRTECLWILWRYTPDDGFIELGRAAACAWEWMVDLGPLLERALNQARSAVPTEALLNLQAIETRIRSVIDGELERLAAPDRLRLVAVLHDAIASRFAREAA